jgi:hypothetical protein
MKEVKFILAPVKFLLAPFNPPISISVLTSEGKKGFFGTAVGGGLGAVAGSLINLPAALIGGAAGILAGGNHTKVTYTVTYFNGWVTTRTVPHKEFVKIYNRIAKQIASYERGQARKARKAAKGQVKAQKESAKIQSEMLKAQREANSMLQMTKQPIESNPPQQKHNSTDVAFQILALSELYKQGILNESEFEAAKAKVLGNKISSTENANASLTAFTQQTSSTPLDVQAAYQQNDIETNTSSFDFALQKFKYLCGWACGSFFCLSGIVFIFKAPVAGVFLFMEDNLVDLKLSPLQRIGAAATLFLVAVLFFTR